MKIYTCLVRNVHKMMFINVADEAITAIIITFLLSSDEICFTWIFEQSAFVVSLFGVATINFVIIVVVVVVFSAVVVTDVLGARIVDTNLEIGS